jgi:hypothetical protein
MKNQTGKVSLFLLKSWKKKQAEMQRKQATHSVSIYYGLKEFDFDKSSVVKNKNEIISIKKF